MPIIKNRGLRGLPGLNNISEEERQAFMLANEDKLKSFRSPKLRNMAADLLYNNQLFANTFGEDAFNEVNDGTEDSYNLRNEMLREHAINTAFDKAFKPKIENGIIDKFTGAGEYWNKLQELSLDSKEKLLKSNWMTPKEFEDYHKDTGDWLDTAVTIGDAVLSAPTFLAKKIFGGDVENFLNAVDLRQNAKDMLIEGYKQYKREQNNNVLDAIYNDQADNAAHDQAVNVATVYGNPKITGESDEDTMLKFKQAITPDAATGNMGIPEYASRWGDGTDPSSEMEDFSIDDMRQVLAKKYVYDRTMSPNMAATALNNEAKRYITAHQGSFKRLGLFANDVGIAALSYSADKINGIYNFGLYAADELGDKPIVWVDDTGNVVSPSAVVAGINGNAYTQGEDGKIHPVHQMEMDRTTLHNMGKDFDGNDDDSILNPLYWTRAEQFGTLDEDEQKQYEKLGSSPYKVSYNPNDESDLVYESFKMMSFGLADGVSMFIPFGVGTAGRVLSTAGKVGGVVNKLGKVMDFTGRALSAQTRFGQVAQGLAGAGGIAYAYQRGAFQEMLAQNLANAEEVNLNRSKQEIAELYANDEQYKAEVDNMIAERAAVMKKAALEQGQDIPDEQLMASAAAVVQNELVTKNAQERKGTEEYAALQQRAIQEAGNAAWRTFLPEAIKYGLVNTVGYRKFLYTNPQGLKKPVAKMFEKMKEVTTSEGRKRLAVDTSELMGNTEKLKKLGKVVGSQFWGGAWTNGTDDMMVDAAERTATDSFNRYLNAYENGEALADEYGFIDGLYSYKMGLGNSLGQSTTWNAAAVGGFGSLVSATPNMANIAHLATKEGREAFKNNFQKRLVYETDESGYKKIKRDEDGNPVTEDVGLGENWRERLGFFVQNGVLNTYYGAKQDVRALQDHADYMNGILDKYEDFKALRGLIASDIERQNAETLGDEKTMRFIHAFESINALERLAEDKNDTAKFSSVVDEARALIEGASKLGTNESNMSEEQITSLLSEYYSHNPGVAESDPNHEIALSHIAQNAKKMTEAYEAYRDAEAQINRYEKDRGVTIVPAVKFKMQLSKALTGHWEDRIKKMQDEIGDVSNATVKPEGETLIATYGGITNAKNRLKMYETGTPYMTSDGELTIKFGVKPLTDLLNAVNARVSKALERYNKAQQEFRDAVDSNAKFAAEQKVKDAKTAYEEALAERDFRQDELTNVQEEKRKLQEAIDQHQTGQNKVLTAEEIMALDPISRARMLDPNESYRYTAAQIKEINKLIKDLKNRDKNGDPMQKIQDIAKLTLNVAQAKDAYDRMSKNPDAAALQLEKQTVQEAERAYNLINDRNAKTLANAVQEMADGLKVNKVGARDIDNQVYRLLRKYNSTLLDVIDKQELLPTYRQQIADAKAWSDVLADIDTVVNQSNESDKWKETVGNAVDTLISPLNNRDEIINTLEQAIDNNHPQAEAFEKILSDMADLEYQRNATVVEKRKERKEREEAARVKAEEDRKKAEEAAKAAAGEAAKKAEEENTVKSGENNINADIARESFDNGQDIDLGTEEKPAEEASAGKPTGTGAEGEAAVVQQPTEQEALDILVDWAEGRLDGNEAIKRLDGTEYVKHTKGNKSLGTTDGVHLSNAVERVLGKYVTEKYPFLHYGSVNETAGGMFQGVNLTVITDNEGNEYGTPSNFLRSLATNPNGKAAEVVKKGQAAMQQNPETSVIDNVEKGHNDELGDYVEGHSLTAAEEAQQVEEGVTAEVDTGVVDVDAVNDIGNQEDENNPETLSGNAMHEYDTEALKAHKLEHRKGAKKGDTMDKYFTWMDTAGIKLQNIIDDELPKIFAKNPRVKIKFACVRPDHNATNDIDMVSHLMLIIDYDGSVKSIHNEDNGGVIESEGNKYLIVGIAGYGNNTNRRSLYNNIYGGGTFAELGLLQRNKVQYFKDHPSERFRVLKDVYTEIVPGSMIPGWIIKQGENDAPNQHRRISELLADSERNPHKLSMNGLSWSIIEYTNIVDVNTRGREVMHPQNQNANAGRVFVHIPAGNGKLLAAKIDPVFFGDKNPDTNEQVLNQNSKLYQDIQQAFMQLVAPTYKDRYDALLKLFQVLYITKEGHNILLSENSDAITFTREGVKVGTLYANDPEVHRKLSDVINAWRPRINITTKIISDSNKLREYDEAGALTTDLAKLGTAGVNYSIYPVAKDGTIIKPTDTNWTTPRRESDSQYRDTSRQEIRYLGGYSYYYDAASDTYTKDGELVPESMRAELDYARRIIGLSPTKIEGVWNYYVLSEGEKSEVIRQNNGTNKIEEVTGEKAQKLITELKEKQEAAAREAAALEKLGEEEEGNAIVDEETGEVRIEKSEAPIDMEAFKDAIIAATLKFYRDNNTSIKPESLNILRNTPASQIMLNPHVANIKDMQEIQDVLKRFEKLVVPAALTAPAVRQEGTQNFSQVIRSKNRTDIINAIKEKISKDSTWADAPIKSPKQLEEYLRKKGAQLDMIPADKNGFEAWIHNNITCK